MDTYFELNGCSGRALLRLCLWWEELGKELIFALLQHHLQVNEQSVGVLVEEAGDVVVDIAGIMHDSEAVLALLDIGDLEVLVTSTVLVQLIEQCLVAGIGEDTFFIQEREDATALIQTSLALITNDNVSVTLTRSINSTQGLLLKYLIGSHGIPSLTYSSCSDLSVSSMKICCNFSFT